MESPSVFAQHHAFFDIFWYPFGKFSLSNQRAPCDWCRVETKTEHDALPTDWDKKFDFQKYTRQHLRLILSPQDHQQSLSLGTNPVYKAVPYFPHDKLSEIVCVMGCKKSALLIVRHMPEVIFVTDLAIMLTDHRMSCCPIRAKYRLFKTVCEQTSDNSPNDSSSSGLN